MTFEHKARKKGRKVTRRFEEYKKSILKAAKDLCYGDDIKKMIQDAETEIELTRAMQLGRSRMRD